jgi:hypothetical protein
MYEYRCDERLKPKSEGSTRLTYPGLRRGLERLNIETRLIDERLEDHTEVVELATGGLRKLNS